MVNITQAIELKRKGYTDAEVAQELGISQEAVNKALNRAKEKGLWNGKVGTNLTYEKYLESTKNSKMPGRPLTRNEWNDLWKGEPIEHPKEEREILPDGSLKPKPFPKYRCIKRKCMQPLTPLKEVYFVKGKDYVRQQLLAQGYTHICLKCLTVYERPKEVTGELGNCPLCGSELVMTTYKGQPTNLLYCLSCEKGFEATEEELDKIEKLSEKIKTET